MARGDRVPFFVRVASPIIAGLLGLGLVTFRCETHTF
jgi:hypothetical protein